MVRQVRWSSAKWKAGPAQTTIINCHSTYCPNVPFAARQIIHCCSFCSLKSFAGNYIFYDDIKMNHGSKWIRVLSKSSAQKALQILLSLKCVEPALNGFHALQDQYVEYNLYLELKTKCQASQNVSAQLSAASGAARWPYNHSKRGAWLMGTDKIGRHIPTTGASPKQAQSAGENLLQGCKVPFIQMENGLHIPGMFGFCADNIGNSNTIGTWQEPQDWRQLE